MAQSEKSKTPHVTGAQVWMSILVSVAVGGSALYIILSNKYGQHSSNWAYGVVGTLFGYWLKK
jgi:hypothetical protein